VNYQHKPRYTQTREQGNGEGEGESQEFSNDELSGRDRSGKIDIERAPVMFVRDNAPAQREGEDRMKYVTRLVRLAMVASMCETRPPPVAPKRK
jgi:hypothetical protein